MSIRNYQPRRRDLASAGRNRILLGLLAITIALQMSYPLIHGNALTTVTICTVIAGAITMLFHALTAYGFRYFLTYLILTFAFAMGVEELGLHTGWPFGQYTYSPSLGLHLWGMPVLVPFAWIMLAHPVLVAARRFCTFWIFLFGGLGLMAWDLFLDPQMVAAGRWSWHNSTPHVPFQPEIPLSNTFGWLLAGIALMALLNFTLPKSRLKLGLSSQAIKIFIGWTLFSGVVGNIFFFHRPGTALFAGLIFAAIFVPYFLSDALGRPDSAA